VQNFFQYSLIFNVMRLAPDSSRPNVCKWMHYVRHFQSVDRNFTHLDDKTTVTLNYVLFTCIWSV